MRGSTNDRCNIRIMKLKTLLFLAVSALLAVPNMSYGQLLAPNLRTLTTFALFTANGAFTANGNATTVTGDVGTNVGAFTGFPPGTLIGNKRLPGSPEAAQAALDVVAAFNYAKAQNCDRIILPDLTNQILTSGVSCQNTAAATTLNGPLTLSGPGIFIIKLSSALVTGTNSSIVLINGATANNVFFQIDGALTAGTSSALQGTFLVRDAIVLNTGASLNGRGLSVQGAITLNDNVVTRTLAPMPVTLVSFTATKSQTVQMVDVAWTTSLEINNRGFIVERSKDLTNFDNVGEVNEIAANSNALKNYRLTDRKPFAGTSYYRLKQTDLDGRVTTYPAVSVVIRDDAYGVFPNPVGGDGQFALRLDEPETAIVRFYGTDAKLLPLQKTKAQSGNLLLKTTSKLSTGVYIITVEERGQMRQHRLLVE